MNQIREVSKNKNLNKLWFLMKLYWLKKTLNFIYKLDNHLFMNKIILNKCLMTFYCLTKLSNIF